MKNSLRKVLHPEKARSVTIAMAFFLILSSLLAPVMPMVEAATLGNFSIAEAAALANNQTVPLNQEQGTPPPDDQGEQLPPNGDGDGSPVDEEGEEPPANGGEEQPGNGNGEQPPTDSPAYWTIFLHWCPPGVDMASVPAQRGGLESQCIRRGPAVQATITPLAGGFPVLQQTIRDFDNFIGFQEMPGDWLFNIQSVPNIVERFDCEGRSPAGMTKPYTTHARTPGGFQMSTVSGEHLECWWFGQMQNTSVLQVVKYNCPSGFDFASSSSSSAREACTEPVTASVGFEVASTDNSHYVTYQRTQLATGNTAIFDNVPTGNIRVSEEVPEGYWLAGAYCSLTDWSRSDSPQEPVAQSTIPESSLDTHWVYTSAPFTHMKCEAYNVPIGSPDATNNNNEDETEDIEPRDARLTVHIAWCVPDTDLSLAASGPEPLLSECRGQGPRVDLNLYQEGSTTPADTLGGITGRFPREQTDWNLDQANWTLQFSPPPGTTHVLACESVFPGSPVNNPYKPHEMVAGNEDGSYQITTIQNPLTPNSEHIRCYWFGQMEYFTSLNLSQKFCESGLNTEIEVYENFIPECDEATPENQDSAFTLTNSTVDPVRSLNLELNAGNNYQTATWDFPNDNNILDPTLTPDGFDLAAIYCDSDPFVPFSPPDKWRSQERTGENSFDILLTYNAAQRCIIYFQAMDSDDQQGEDENTNNEQQVTTSTFEMDTYWCQPGTDLTNPYSLDISTACSEDANGVEVTVQLSSLTNGAVGYNEVVSPGNSVSLPEIPGDHEWFMSVRSSGIADQTLYCRTLNDSGDEVGGLQLYPLSSTAVRGYEFLIPGGQAFECDWFGVRQADERDGDEIDHTEEDPATGVFVTKYQCHESMPTGEMDAFTWYTANCTDYMVGVTFGLSVYLGEPVGSGVTDANGHAMLYEGTLESNQYLLTERDLPEGYSAVQAFCRDISLEGQTSEWTSYNPDNNGILVAFGGNHGKECLWFNYADPNLNPQQDAEYSLTLHKRQCPQGAMYGQMADYYSTECITELNGVLFTIEDANDSRIEPSTTPSLTVNGLVGEVSITEFIDSGWDAPVAFCSEMNNGAQPSPMTVTNGSITLPASEYGYECFWYNIPIDDFSVTLYKWQCPQGTMYGEMESYYSTECATELNGVLFTVTDENDSHVVASSTPYRAVNGLLGEISITEVVPEGWGTPVVFCKLTSDQSGTPYDVTHSFYEATINLPPATGEDHWECRWYNIPLQDFSLTLYKWQCPQGTMYGEMESYYSAECNTQHADVPFQVTSDNGTVDFMSDTNGYQVDGLRGQVILREMGLPGYGDPVVYCQLLNDNNGTLYTSTNGIVVLPPAMGDDYQCNWYNIPELKSSITVYKWRCPDGMPAEKTQQWFMANCENSPMEAEFTLTDSQGTQPPVISTGGMVQWMDVATGAIQVKETVPPGFDPHPYIVCEFQNSITTDMTPTSINGVWNGTIEHEGVNITCDWYNWYLGPGDITVHKRICPEGYNRHAWDADPMTDCTEMVNGITFKLDQPDPDVDLFSDTGDSMESAVFFGGLAPGDYILSEMVGPGEYQDIFTWQCYGLTMSSVHPTPLSVGQDLEIKIVGGDDIECYWFNVPYPQYGYMVVSKYNCSTEKWVSDVYCYTNQTGQYFDLQMWNGSTWSTVKSGTTDVSGKVTFDMLDAGEYRLIEPNKQACLMKSSNITSGGNLGVTTGEGTTVYVYNCKTPPPPQKTPTKYPNTGVAPSADSVRTPGVELAGLAGLLGMALNRRRVLAGAGVVTAGAAASALPLLNAQELVPLDSTPAPGTPSPDVFWCATPTAGTPEAAGTPVVDPCNRGPIPIQMRIPIIEVDAPIEYLEIIDGLMQQPTGDTHIAWYKETSRLGEVGNGIYAAHVNWYGNPEGIFFRLESLKEGDVIEIDGDDLQTYLFEVQWMQDFPSDEEPPEEALGLTDEVAITLITCGGEWSSELSEYDHRTLVRAVLRE